MSNNPFIEIWNNNKIINNFFLSSCFRIMLVIIIRLLTSLYRGGSEGESDESKVLYLEEWNGGKIRVQGLKWLNTYTRMCLCIEERGILE